MSHIKRKKDDNPPEYTGLRHFHRLGDGEDSMAPYIPTPQSLVNTILEIAKAGPGDILYDLGCGDGRFLITAVKDFKVDRAVGYEINTHLHSVALNNVAKNELKDRIRVEDRNLMDADLRDATLIILYLTTSGNTKLKPKLKKELHPGTQIISHDFPIKNWITTDKDKNPKKIGDHKIYHYTIPEAYTN